MIVDKNTIDDTIFLSTKSSLYYDDFEHYHEKVYEKYYGSIGTICPSCLKPSVFNLYNKIKVSAEDNKIRITNRNIIRVCCSECDEEYPLVEFDPNIVWAISELNKKGYQTNFSCEGHTRPYYTIDENGNIEEHDNPCYPYISFRNSSDEMVDAFNNTPLEEMWYYDFFYHAFGNGGKRKITIVRGYINNIEDLDDPILLRERIQSLNNWVSRLPDISKKVIQRDFVANK